MMIISMDPKREIRTLPPSIIRELSKILDHGDSWKTLMAIIPKRLYADTFICDIKYDNVAKYNSEDFKIIEQGGSLYKRSCTEILIDEWGTSGRIRANLGHLKYLLIKANLYRAAEYVAKLLNEEPPPRPTYGPAAIISTNLTKEFDPNLKAIEEKLDKINYPEIAINEMRNIPHENRILNKKIPQIVISDADNNVENDQSIFNLPLVLQRDSASTAYVVSTATPYTEVSDFMKFSNSTIESDILPKLSELLDNSTPNVSSSSSIDDTTSSIEIPQINDRKITSLVSERSEELVPAFSEILGSTNDNQTPLPSLSMLLDKSSESSTVLPMLSIFKQEEELSSENILPNFDILSIKQLESSSNKSIASPLPNLSLCTELPHFTYKELEATTNNFNENDGRLLGKGAFGSVFLAINLIDQPVAVKKILLENNNVVNDNDIIIKQFRNEVEFLSKYKHENLVSLLGYSCDGCTYCLVYEYVCGGSLYDVIQNTPLKLPWSQRLHVAFGIAKGITYLHTAFATPLIHRDIKSANILLDSNHNPKLCDFGIVKLLPNNNTHTNTTVPYGTSPYMSPEYHRGDVSIKLDTFSFGVVLLELLTSLPPIDYNRENGTDLVTHVEDICEDTIEPLLDRNIGNWMENGINFAMKLYEITVKCLEEKKKRPVMFEVKNELEETIKLL